jgi:mRNA interferase MazF
VSPKAYNKKVGLALLCPITSHIKGYPFEVVFPDGHRARGAVLSDQVKSLDWKVRKAERFCRAPAEVTDEVIAKIVVLLEGE